MSNAQYDVIISGAGISGMYQLWKLRKLGLTVDPTMPTLIGQCWPSRLWWVALGAATSASWTEADGIAAEGMRLVKENLPAACRDGKNLEARANMMCAATMGACEDA